MAIKEFENIGIKIPPSIQEDLSKIYRNELRKIFKEIENKGEIDE